MVQIKPQHPEQKKHKALQQLKRTMATLEDQNTEQAKIETLMQIVTLQSQLILYLMKEA